MSTRSPIPDIIAAIKSGARHKIALTYVEWAGAGGANTRQWTGA